MSNPKSTQKNSYHEYYESKMKKNNTGKKSHNNSTFNIQSVMIEIIVKPLVERLIDMKEDLAGQENLVCIKYHPEKF
jgi:hypothetical protein